MDASDSEEAECILPSPFSIARVILKLSAAAEQQSMSSSRMQTVTIETRSQLKLTNK
jgi:hypothetical protein